MFTTKTGALVVALGTALALTGCVTSTPTAGAKAQLPQGSEPVTLDPANFSTTIDNPYWPMTPGTRSTFREIGPGGEQVTVVLTVTSDTRKIANGIEARVVRDTVTQDGAIIEDTFDWYAQDSAGTIWYLGEDTAEFENGIVTSTEGSFEAGVDGALPGVLIPGEPNPGQTYRQEYYQGIAEDNGEVFSVTEQVEVPFGHFDDVLLTRDTITIKPEVLEYKFYAPGVGPVLILDISGGAGREELVSTEQVPPGTGLGPLGQPEQL